MKSLLLLSLLFVTAVLAQSQQAALHRILPSQDAYLFSGAPDSSFGTSNFLLLGFPGNASISGNNASLSGNASVGANNGSIGGNATVDQQQGNATTSNVTGQDEFMIVMAFDLRTQLQDLLQAGSVTAGNVTAGNETSGNQTSGAAGNQTSGNQTSSAAGNATDGQDQQQAGGSSSRIGTTLLALFLAHSSPNWHTGTILEIFQLPSDIQWIESNVTFTQLQPELSALSSPIGQMILDCGDNDTCDHRYQIADLTNWIQGLNLEQMMGGSNISSNASVSAGNQTAGNQTAGNQTAGNQTEAGNQTSGGLNNQTSGAGQNQLFSIVIRAQSSANVSQPNITQGNATQGGNATQAGNATQSGNATQGSGANVTFSAANLGLSIQQNFSAIDFAALNISETADVGVFFSKESDINRPFLIVQSAAGTGVNVTGPTLVIFDDQLRIGADHFFLTGDLPNFEEDVRVNFQSEESHQGRFAIEVLVANVAGGAQGNISQPNITQPNVTQPNITQEGNATQGNATQGGNFTQGGNVTQEGNATQGAGANATDGGMPVQTGNLHWKLMLFANDALPSLDGVDLTRYRFISFWAKANQASNIFAVFGTGEDSGFKGFPLIQLTEEYQFFEFDISDVDKTSINTLVWFVFHEAVNPLPWNDRAVFFDQIILSEQSQANETSNATTGSQQQPTELTGATEEETGATQEETGATDQETDQGTASDDGQDTAMPVESTDSPARRDLEELEGGEYEARLDQDYEDADLNDE